MANRKKPAKDKPTCSCCATWWTWAMPGRRDGCHLWPIFRRSRKNYYFYRSERRIGNRVYAIQKIIERRFFSLEMKMIGEKWQRIEQEAC